MPPLYRMAEVALYALLNFLPFLVLAIYPFRNSLRFSRKSTGFLIGELTVIQLLLGAGAAFLPGENAGKLSIISTTLYGIFYFLAVKKNFGKTLFTLLMISNMANFAVIASKCMEGLFFPDLAIQSYRWSYSLMLFIVEVILAVPIFIYMKKVIAPALEREPSGFEWWYLWLIPATFYILWTYGFYGNISRTGLQIALRPKNTLFLFMVNIGAVLIYYVVTRLILERYSSLELEEKNHQLTMQIVQYENLQEKIMDARRAKHDVRHHIVLMQNYLNNGELEALSAYLDRYHESLPDDSLIRFCENTAANTVLLYFAQLARDDGIEYIVKTEIPEELFVSETDISVLLGNLLENALEACRAEMGEERKIIVRASLKGGTFCMTVDNTCTKETRASTKGGFISMKHEGLGLGTKSVKSIAEQYGGVCRFETKDGMFYASVLCSEKGN